MSFWNNDEFKGLSESGRKPRRTIFYGGTTRTWTGLLILTPILLLAVGWLFIVPFFLNHASSGGKGSSSFNEHVILAANRVKPSVVSVISLVKQAETQGAQEKVEPMVGMGSGIIFRIEGKMAFVVTNQHVIEGASALEIVFVDGERRKAKLVGADRFTDLAVLQVDSKGIERVARFGDSDKLKAGESAIAIGNPLGLGYSQTITAGIISAPLRTVPVSLNRDGQLDWEVDLIQTDAAINSGNSGGALANLDGDVIGINSLKVSDFGVEGLGFAIPSNQAIPIMDSLLEFGKVKRPFIGVTTADLNSYMEGTETLKLPDDVKQGIIVLEAIGPAKEAGMQTGDVIVQLDNQKINTMLDLRKYLYLEKKIGDDVEVGFYREHRRGSVIMTLAELDAEE
jgi:serine protease Do